MGGSNSKKQEPPRLKNAEIQEFSRQSLVRPDIIEKLYGHFYRIASSQHDDGVIDINEFCLMIHKNQNRSLIIEGLFNLFDANHDGVINFREFLQGISIFKTDDSFANNIHESSPVSASKIKEQIDLSVRILDISNKKKIYLSEVKKLLISAVRENTQLKLSENTIEVIVSRTFENEVYKTDDQGPYISLEEYSKMIYRNPAIVSWLSADEERIKQDYIKKPPKTSKSRCMSV